MSRITNLLFLVVCTLLTPALGCDINVAGYSRFSETLENSTIIGLLFVNDNEVYTSRCFSLNQTCEDERLLYSHNSTLTDLDVYYEGCTIFITDISGGIHVIDIKASPITVEHLSSQWQVAELSVDWLSPLLYVLTQTQQLYKCDMMLRNCLHLHDEYLTYTPRAIAADAFNGYLYWITDTGMLIKHDMAKEISGSMQNIDVAIRANVSTYSVAYDCYDLYSIYNYDVAYREITLTYLDGENVRTHLPLEHTPGDIYTELNCIHDTHCLWLETNNNSTLLHWSLQESGQLLSIENLNISAKSLLTLWNRQAQPLPVPTTYPDFTEYYSDSTGIRMHWDKPDIVGHYLLKQQVLARWSGLLSKDSKYMQSEAAWSAWNYELNITSDEYFQSITNLTDLSLYIGDLQPSTNYSVSILAYTETDRGPMRTVTCRTLSSDPLIYTSTTSHLRAIDAFGDLKQTWNVSSFSWVICEMIRRDESLLYMIVSPRLSVGCIDKSTTTLVLLDISSKTAIVSEEVTAISAVGYDWIGKMVYMASSDTQALFRADAYAESLNENMEKLASLNLVIKHLSIDSVNGRIYWTPTRDNNLYSFDMGPADSYEVSAALYDGLPYRRLNGPVVDMTSNKVHWAMTSLLTTILYSRDLIDNTQTSVESSIDMSGQPFIASDDKFYVILNSSLRTLDVKLKTNYNSLGTNVIAFLYYSPSFHPRLEGKPDS
ncbi:proto-oncogene tyrosine-protein kinase ROS-like [Watersipora subatra]|uniref:proto-oncogene tyrosine-protein kinase ROS-like n=1 Tax=Watersipora subatra TaxID=2589382 RepID=UPI00355AF89F